jgi:hypothetical protein
LPFTEIITILSFLRSSLLGSPARSRDEGGRRHGTQ